MGAGLTYPFPIISIYMGGSKTDDDKLWGTVCKAAIFPTHVAKDADPIVTVSKPLSHGN